MAYDAAPTIKTKSAQTSPTDLLIGAFALLVLFGLPAFLIWSVAPDSIRYPALYGALNSVPYSHVYVDKQPTDCDWGHAPIGDKACHYTKNVQVIRDDSGRATDVYITWEKVSE